MPPLTPRQRELYLFLKAYVEREEVAPTYEEIRRYLGVRSYNAVQKLLKQLERRGYIRSPWKNSKRAIEVLDPDGTRGSLPLLGTVAAGRPIEAVEEFERVGVPESFLGGGERFALRVRGESMVDDGIHDGDVIVVRAQQTAENGQTVVALIGNEATVKRFYHKNEQVGLRPANPAMEPIFLDAGEVTVQGVVIGLIRSYR